MMSHMELARGHQAEHAVDARSRYGYTRTNRPDVDAERQHRALRDSGVQEQAIFTDFVVSGRNSAAQTQLRALLSMVREGDTIVVDHLYRLGRDPIRVGELLAELKGRGVAIEITEHALGGELLLAVCALGVCPPRDSARFVPGRAHAARGGARRGEG